MVDDIKNIYNIVAVKQYLTTLYLVGECLDIYVSKDSLCFESLKKGVSIKCGHIKKS